MLAALRTPMLAGLLAAAVAWMPAPASAQEAAPAAEPTEVDVYEPTPEERAMCLELTFYRSKRPLAGEDGEVLWTYYMPEFPRYAPKRFRSERERRRYSRLVRDVRRVLPIAKEARGMLIETYEVLETLPTKREKDAHLAAVERDIKRTYTPKMKQLTFSQGKLLIKLIDRECHQEAFDILWAFLGPARATFYQVFAWTFNASLKRGYDPEGEDREVERIVRQIETGQM